MFHVAYEQTAVEPIPWHRGLKEKSNARSVEYRRIISSASKSDWLNTDVLV